MNRPKHLNSLGYVVTGSATERSSAQAMIAWGEKENGALVHIDDAAPGLADGLICACGAPLVARKGSVRTNHFAHKAGTVEACEQAQLRALSRFARRTLLEVGKLTLPSIQGRRLTTTVDEIREEIIGRCAGLWVTTVKGEKRGEIAVLFFVKRGQKSAFEVQFRALQKSAMVIDLTAFRNCRDPEIAFAIATAEDSDWIYNARHPNWRERSGPRSIFRQKSHSAGTQITAPTSQTKLKSAITEEEWQTLHYTELRRRVFGWTDKK
ncbi:hypothetical protein [Qipengyuania atrilutea]|uniref:Uncharacterized protein n=1 Tax=Qipengyuania atrilutea TaxID=2744473 RepID=A0A850H5G7_9SPHN|nr:hypothetical protein [Actirhodobacter atriluteus]NVD45093.1 hypothetical protein [Actirhodobacter atriluteus]